MAALPPHVADKAREEAAQWEDFRDSATFAAAGVVPVIVGLAGPAVGTICGTAAASMVMLGSRKARAATRKANDPPDADFNRPVVARRAHFNKDAFGSSPLERATVRASYALLYDNAYDLAMVRAEERAMGAREAGDREAESDRSDEARLYASRSIESSEEVREATSELADQLDAIGAGHSAFDVGDLPRTLDEALSDQTLVMLFRAGFRIEDLRVRISSRREVLSDPLGFIAAQLRLAGYATGEFGQALASVIEEVFRPESS